MKRRFSRLVFVCALLAALWGGWQYWKDHRYDAQIKAAAKRHQISPGLIKAVVWQESRFDQLARGSKGEIGLMQIREPAAREWAEAEKIRPFVHTMIYDAGLNTRAGAWYLSKLLKRYKHTDDPVPYALADYNAGRGNVLKWNQGAGATNSAVFIQQITFPSTRKYIENVRQRYRHYGDTL